MSQKRLFRVGEIRENKSGRSFTVSLEVGAKGVVAKNELLQLVMGKRSQCDVVIFNNHQTKTAESSETYESENEE